MGEKMRKLIVAGIGVSLLVATEVNSFETIPPYIKPISAYSTIVNDHTLEARITAGGFKLPFKAVRSDVESNGFFWRNAYIDDWDLLPADARERGLEKLMEKYKGFLFDAGKWSEMNASSWDYVPPPVRTIAYMNMIDYWSRHYNGGKKFGMSTKEFAGLVKAIVKAESWYEHRAINRNPDGTKDLGLSHLTDCSRKSISNLFGKNYTGKDYLNPLVGTEAAVLWFSQMLNESNGDVKQAVRAYNKGTAKAREGEGAEYYERVSSLSSVISNPVSPAMQFLLSAVMKYNG